MVFLDLCCIFLDFCVDGGWLDGVIFLLKGLFMMEFLMKFLLKFGFVVVVLFLLCRGLVVIFLIGCIVFIGFFFWGGW